MLEDKIKVICDFQDYITDVLVNNDENEESIESLYKLIKYYYKKRIDIKSKFFDSIAFLNNNNDNFINLYEKDDKYKKELDLFIKNTLKY